MHEKGVLCRQSGACGFLSGNHIYIVSCNHDTPASESKMAENLNIDEPVLIIRVNKLYRPSMTPTELYEITRGIWKVTGSRRDCVQYAFSVYKGVVKEVYKVNTWYPAMSTPYQTRTEPDITLHGQISMTGRWEFIGEVAEPAIRNKYIDRSVAFLFPQGAANPIKYVNC